MLADHAEIYVRGGDGGHGCVSFRRERAVPRGGPDGGDGGHGGEVRARACPNTETLLDFSERHHWIAENGRPGMGKNRTGRSRRNLVLNLPVGTLIYDRETGILLKDMNQPDLEICVAAGGKGGRGNASFATPTHQVPYEAEPGEPGQERWLRLELKLLADVGIVGLPNAGKSTLLSRLSKAKPKIADYPFTTLKPQLGIVELSDHRRFVLADIPGLIEGAHAGAGLGDGFLRHIERTRVILHLVDVGSPYLVMPPAAAYATVRAELAKYSPALAAKPEVLVANKVDLPEGKAGAEALQRAVGVDVLPISAVTGMGVPQLAEILWAAVRREKEPPTDSASQAAAPLSGTRP